MDELTLARDLAIIGSIAFFGGATAKLTKLPLAVGYILAGLLFNSFFPAVLHDRQSLNSIANIGVALLLFSIGIEFSFKKLYRIKSLALKGTALQIIISSIIITVFGLLVKLNLYEAFFFGAIASLSSTAIVVRILSDKNALETREGDISLNWLLVQDLAVLPLTLLLPAMSGFTGGDIIPNILNLLKAIGISLITIYIILILGRRILPKIMEKIGSLNSRELMLLSSISLSIIAAFIFEKVGLSFALGAFVAGLLLSSSFQNHAIFAEIRPIRDLFSMVFFVLLGMMTNLQFFLQNLWSILILAGAVVIIKYLVVYFLLRRMDFHRRVSSQVAVNLVQIGEFAFVISLSALNGNIISSYLYSLVISVALITIVITPFLMENWLKWRNKLLPAGVLEMSAANIDNLQGIELPFRSHVVICGYGRVGRHIGEVLKAHEIPFVVVDLNQKIIQDQRLKEIPVVYGDPTEIGVLDYAQVDKAAVVVIAIPDRYSQEQIIINSLNLNRNITVICRSHVDDDKMELISRGAHLIVQPEFEAALSISHKILELFSIPKDSITTTLKGIREFHER